MTAWTDLLASLSSQGAALEQDRDAQKSALAALQGQFAAYKASHPDAPPVTPARSVTAVLGWDATKAPNGGTAKLAAVGFTADQIEHDAGTGDGAWSGTIAQYGSTLTALHPGKYVVGLHDQAKGDWVTTTVTVVAPAPTGPPPVTPPVTPPSTATRLAGRLLQGWFLFNDASAIPAFEATEGAPLDVFHLSVDGNDPNPPTLTTYGHLADWVKGGNRLLCMNWNWMTEAPGDFPNGNIDAKAVQVAQFLQQLGIADKVIIRPGYEMNAFWMPWGDSYPGNYTGASFKAMWIRVIPQMLEVAPALRVDWCVNPGTATGYDPANPNGGSADPELFWPGKFATFKGKQVQIVHFIGIDQYPWWGITNLAGFVATPKGISWAASFAAAQGLPWGIDETASVDPNAGTQGGGDNGQFYTDLLNWCDAHNCSWVLYEAVADGGVGYNGMPADTAAHWGAWFRAHR